MNKTITVSEETFYKLEDLARLRGFQNVEQLIEQDFQVDERRKELAQRQALGREIDAFRERMFEKYGVMPDSTPLIREDRER